MDGIMSALKKLVSTPGGILKSLGGLALLAGGIFVVVLSKSEDHLIEGTVPDSLPESIDDVPFEVIEPEMEEITE